MQIIGTIEKILPIQNGESAKGGWVKQDVIINQGGQYPSIVCVTFFGTKCTPEGCIVGDSVEIEVNAKSNESNGKYFTNLTAWKIKIISGETKSEIVYPEPEKKEPIPYTPVDETDDLPF